MKIAKKLAITAAEALAGAVLIAANLQWLTLAKRRLRSWRAAA